MKTNTTTPITTVIRCPDCPVGLDKETGQPQEDPVSAMISDWVRRVLNEYDKDGEPTPLTIDLAIK